MKELPQAQKSHIYLDNWESKNCLLKFWAFFRWPFCWSQQKGSWVERNRLWKR